MNLNSYDDALKTVDKTKTWFNIKTRTIFSREIKYRSFITIGKRYNRVLDCNNYYLILLDHPPTDRKYYRPTRDNYGRIKIRINPDIIHSTILSDFKVDTNINIQRVEGDESYDIYYLDI